MPRARPGFFTSFWQCKIIVKSWDIYHVAQVSTIFKLMFIQITNLIAIFLKIEDFEDCHRFLVRLITNLVGKLLYIFYSVGVWNIMTVHKWEYNQTVSSHFVMYIFYAMYKIVKNTTTLKCIEGNCTWLFSADPVHFLFCPKLAVEMIFWWNLWQFKFSEQCFRY